tara:strand:- start:1442 stop:1588 length:147 start_codon:yes stop_codon:yes gene_type:complete
MSDRLSLAAEVKQLQQDQEKRAAEWKEGQAKLDAKTIQLVKANTDEVG